MPLCHVTHPEPYTQEQQVAVAMTTNEPQTISFDSTSSYASDRFPSGKIQTSKLSFLAALVIALILTTCGLAFAWKNITYSLLLELASPAILGTLSLLIGLLARNASISDRIRSLGSELNSGFFGDIPPSAQRDRIASISKQLPDFHSRYKINVWSLMAIALNLICLPGIAMTFPKHTKHGIPTSLDEISALTFFVILVSSWLFCYAALACVADIWLSLITVDEEVRHSSSVTHKLENKPDLIDDDANEIVVHFSNVFFWLWYRERIDAVRNSNNTELDRFLFCYLGLHQEEYHFFRNRLLPEKLYCQWLTFLRNESIIPVENKIEPDDRPMGQTSLRAWWRQNRTCFPEPTYQAIVDRVLCLEFSGTDTSKRIYTIDEIATFAKTGHRGGSAVLDARTAL